MKRILAILLFTGKKLGLWLDYDEPQIGFLAYVSTSARKGVTEDTNFGI